MVIYYHMIVFSLLLRIVSVVILPVSAADIDFSAPVISDELIDFINDDPQSLWEAGVNEIFTDAQLSDIADLCGVRGFNLQLNKSLMTEARTSNEQHVSFLSLSHQIMLSQLPVHHPVLSANLSIPLSFDVRSKWGSMCPSVKEIHDQGSCGSCWSVSAASSMTDRICIASNGRLQTRLSSSDPLSCCNECGDGCNGGTLPETWLYWINSGIVSGGPYGDLSTCFPYQFPSCAHHENSPLPACSNINIPAEPCPTTCVNKAIFLEDKHHGMEAYQLTNVADIQADILEHGSVQAAFIVYADFPNYKSGVYHHLRGEALGGHAIRIIGWGVESDVDYWLVANSWNDGWGDKGTFKIKRGVNECGIEDMVYAGRPQL